MLYNPPTGAVTANDPYIGKNVAAGIQGSKVPPHAVEYPQREIVNAELVAGLTPTNADTTQLAQAMSIGLYLGTFDGTANALTAALQGSVTFPALVVGMVFHGIVGAAANTAAATLSLAGFTSVPGVKPIVKKDGSSALAAGDLPAGAIVSLRWDGTSFRHVGSTASDTKATAAPVNSSAGSPWSRTAAGTYTFTATVTGWHIVTTWGAGGGGGGSTSTSSAGGGGGGGGRRIFPMYLTVGQTVPIVLGAGGTGGTSVAAPTAGGSVSVGGVAQASGGSPGANAAGSGSGVGGAPGTGLGSTGGDNTPGQSGGQGNNVGALGGVGGGSPGAGFGAYPSTNTGSPGIGTGSGGGGAVNGQGGAGSDAGISVGF